MSAATLRALLLAMAIASFSGLAILLARPWLVAPEGEADVTVLAENFVAMAYAADRTVLQTWPVPLRVLVLGEGADALAAQVGPALAAFTRLTGLEAQV